jgi:hypothetical protein
MLKRSSLIMALIVGMVALVAWPPPAGAQAQQGCTEFRAVGQATLPSPYTLVIGEDNVWGGQVYGSLGGEFLSGEFSGNDGNSYAHGQTNVATNGTYRFDFGSNVGAFTINVSHAAWPFAPGKVGLGAYRGTATIVEGDGTGRFSFAYGNLRWSGPFIVWPDENSLIGVQGGYNAEIRGNICGVQPPPAQ